MSLSQALATAVSGLRTTQIGLSVVAGNVANAETPGYIRKTPVQIATAAGEHSVGVRVVAIERELDQFVQRQMRVESSGASYADLRSQFYDRLQALYGTPGADSAIESLYNDFTKAVQALATSPESVAARGVVLSSAQMLAQQLRGMTLDIQSLRSDAEQGIADSVTRANEAMQRIADLNNELSTANTADATTANLLDRRDRYIDDLAQIMDIQVTKDNQGRVSIFTNSGIQLVGLQASTLAFDAVGSITAVSQWDADPALRSVGTLVLIGANGSDVDLIVDRSIRSGQLAAYLEMRDQVLVQAQAQLDEFAAGISRALSDRAIGGTAVTVGAQAGFDIDLSGLQDGNTVRIVYTDNVSGSQRTLTLMRVNDPAALPLADTVTPDPADEVIGLDFSGGMASILSQIAAALGGTALQFSNPGGSVLRVLDDGAANQVDVNSVTATVTATSLTGGTAELPFFLDGNVPYTGAIRSIGTQSVGFAGRIVLNPNLVADPSRLIIYQTVPLTPIGDTTRPAFIHEQLTKSKLTFSPQSGIGSTVAPYNGSLPALLRQIISLQGEATAAAANLKQGQDIVFNSLQERFKELAGVNIDQEMASLLNLQNAYGANARVLMTVKEMFDMLMRL